MPIEDRRATSTWRLRIPLIVGALAGAGALTQVGVPTDAQASARIAQIHGEIERIVDPVEPRVVGSEVPATPPSASLKPASVGPKPPSVGPKPPSLDRPAVGDRRDERQPEQPGARREASHPKPVARARIQQQAVASHIAQVWRVDADDVREYVSLAWESAKAHDLDPVLVLAIIATESSFNPKARSKAGAEGLMQVHTRVHKDKLARHGGARAVFDPAVNIKVGSLILKRYIDRYGRTQRALKAYVGAADLAHDNGYAEKVLARRTEFRDVIRNGEIAARAREAREARAAEEAAMLMSGLRPPRS